MTTKPKTRFAKIADWKFAVAFPKLEKRNQARRERRVNRLGMGATLYRPARGQRVAQPELGWRFRVWLELRRFPRWLLILSLDARELHRFAPRLHTVHLADYRIAGEAKLLAYLAGTEFFVEKLAKFRDVGRRPWSRMVHDARSPKTSGRSSWRVTTPPTASSMSAATSAGTPFTARRQYATICGERLMRRASSAMLPLQASIAR